MTSNSTTTTSSTTSNADSNFNFAELWDAASYFASDAEQVIDMIRAKTGADRATILANVAGHAPAARMIAPVIKAQLVNDPERATLFKEYVDALDKVERARSALLEYDYRILAPFQGVDLFEEWVEDASCLQPRQYATEHKRQSRAGNVQGKAIGRGRGKRRSVWTKGTWYIDRQGQFYGYALELTDTDLTVYAPDGEIIYQAQIDWARRGRGPGTVAHHGRQAYMKVYAHAGVDLANRNAPKFWGMPQVQTGDDDEGDDDYEE